MKRDSKEPQGDVQRIWIQESEPCIGDKNGIRVAGGS